MIKLKLIEMNFWWASSSPNPWKQTKGALVSKFLDWNDDKGVYGVIVV